MLVAQNPWQVGGVRVCVVTATGEESWDEVPEVIFDEMGFRQTAVIVGQGYKAHDDTTAQTHAKEMEKLTMGVDTLEQAEQKRKAKALPFDGRIDPYKHHDKVLADDNTLFMPKKGQRLTEHESRAQKMACQIDEPILSKVEIAKQLKPKVEAIGGDWSKAVKVLVERHPNGIIASQIDEVFDELCDVATFKLILKTA